MRAHLVASTFALASLALGCTPPPRPDAQAGQTKPEAETEAAEPTPAAAELEAVAPEASGEPVDTPLGTAKRGDPDFIEAEPGPPLTEEELALIAADPATLTKEQRRARAYATRKKIMLTPDSPEAQAILQGAKALREGTMTVPGFPAAPGGEITLQAPKPAGTAAGASEGKKPAGKSE